MSQQLAYLPHGERHEGYSRHDEPLECAQRHYVKEPCEGRDHHDRRLSRNADGGSPCVDHS